MAEEEAVEGAAGEVMDSAVDGEAVIGVMAVVPEAPGATTAVIQVT